MFAHRHITAAVRHAQRLGVPAADLEDVAQEALLVAWRKREQFRKDDSFEAYLYGITQNIIRHRRRRVSRHVRKLAALEAQDAPHTAATDPVSRAFENAWASLHPHEQQVVHLHLLCELSLQTVAATLQVPADTLKSRVARAREKLAAALGPQHLDAALAGARRRDGVRARAPSTAITLALGAWFTGEATAAAATYSTSGSGALATTSGAKTLAVLATTSKISAGVACFAMAAAAYVVLTGHPGAPSAMSTQRQHSLQDAHAHAPPGPAAATTKPTTMATKRSAPANASPAEPLPLIDDEVLKQRQSRVTAPDVTDNETANTVTMLATIAATNAPPTRSATALPMHAANTMQRPAPTAPTSRAQARTTIAAHGTTPRQLRSAPRAAPPLNDSSSPLDKAALNRVSSPDTAPHSTPPSAVALATANSSEAALIEQAQRALRSGDWRAAQRALMRHVRTYPATSLEPERLLLLAESYEAANRCEVAVRYAAQALHAYPAGPYQQRLGAVLRRCNTAPEPTSRPATRVMR